MVFINHKVLCFILESPKKETETGFSAMENFMKFAASLNSASEHLNKGNNNNNNSIAKQSTKPSWHLPQDFRCKLKKPEHTVEDKSFPKSLTSHLEPKRLAADHKPAEPFGKYGWSNPQSWAGNTQLDLCSWQNHPAYRGEDGRFESPQATFKVKPVRLLFV